MKVAEFIQWNKNALPKECVYSSHYIHLIPEDSEIYMFTIPDGIDSITDIVVVDDNGNQYAIDYSVTQNNGRNVMFVSNIVCDTWDYVRFRILSNDDDSYYYSTRFRVSSLDKEMTTYIKFKDNKWRYFGGVRMRLWYWQDTNRNEISTYYQITTENTVTVGSKRQRLSRYYLEDTFNVVAMGLLDILTYPIVYFNGVRTNAFELPELPLLQGHENFVSFDLLVNRNFNDIDDSVLDLSTYVIGNRIANEFIGDGNNNIIEK